MSLAKIRAALETALSGTSPQIATAWENAYFIPTTGVPYQQAFIDPQDPDNVEFGGGYHQDGIFQINLRYPLLGGTAGAQARAEIYQQRFKRGTTLSNGGLVVTITKTPAIGKGAAVEDRWFLPVRIYFHSQIN